eukprot:7340675-Alexandrium_andersonii.AAC.1
MAQAAHGKSALVPERSQDTVSRPRWEVLFLEDMAQAIRGQSHACQDTVILPNTAHATVTTAEASALFPDRAPLVRGHAARRVSSTARKN